MIYFYQEIIRMDKDKLNVSFINISTILS